MDAKELKRGDIERVRDDAQIRAKQAAKPKHSPLPETAPQPDERAAFNLKGLISDLLVAADLLSRRWKSQNAAVGKRLAEHANALTDAKIAEARATAPQATVKGDGPRYTQADMERYGKCYADARDARRAAVPQAGWTPVSERMPAKPGWYLAMLKSDNDWGLMSDTPLQVEFDAFKSKPKAFTCGYDWHPDEDITAAVTHWMPCPPVLNTTAMQSNSEGE